MKAREQKKFGWLCSWRCAGLLGSAAGHGHVFAPDARNAHDHALAEHRRPPSWPQIFAFFQNTNTKLQILSQIFKKSYY
jgi:hypothetical protein